MKIIINVIMLIVVGSTLISCNNDSENSSSNSSTSTSDSASSNKPKIKLSLCEEVKGATYYSTKPYTLNATRLRRHTSFRFSEDGEVYYLGLGVDEQGFSNKGTYQCNGNIMTVTSNQKPIYELTFSPDLNHFFIRTENNDETSYTREQQNALEPQVCFANKGGKSYQNISGDQTLLVSFTHSGSILVNSETGEESKHGVYDCETGVLHIHPYNDPTPKKTNASSSYSLKFEENILLVDNGNTISRLYEYDNLSPDNPAECVSTSKPVCSFVPTPCDKKPCAEGEYLTFSNICESNAAVALFRFHDECGVVSGRVLNRKELLEPKRVKITNLEITDQRWIQCITDTGATYIDEITKLECNLDYSSISEINVSDFSALHTLKITGDHGVTSLILPEYSLIKTFKIGVRVKQTIDLSTTPLLEELYMQGANSTSLSHNTSLRTLHIENHSIKVVDLSSNPNLQQVSIVGGNVESVVFAKGVPLIALEVSALENAFEPLSPTPEHIGELGASSERGSVRDNYRGRKLVTLDVNSIPTLKTLSLQHNMATLDLSNLAQLETLKLLGPLNDLILPDQASLKTLITLNSALPYLDILNQKDLSTLRIGSNALSTLNLKGLDNITTLEVNADNINSLDLKSQTQVRSLRLSTPLITDLELPNPEKINALTIGNTAIKNLDLSNYTALKYINIPDGIEFLNISNTEISSFDMPFRNKLKGLIANNTPLKDINIAKSELSNIELSESSLITKISISENQLTDLQLSSQVDLTILAIGKSMIEQLELSNQKALKHLSLDESSISTLNLSANEQLEEVSLLNTRSSITFEDSESVKWLIIKQCSHSPLFDLSGMSQLEKLDFSECNTPKIDLSMNPELVNLNIKQSKIEELNLQSNFKLDSLYLSVNEIPSLDLSNNTKLTKVYIPKPRVFRENFKCEDIIGGDTLDEQLNNDDDPTGKTYFKCNL